MIDPQVAFDKIDQFTTPQELRQFFIDSGIKGPQRAAFSCPIANYMGESTGKRFGVDSLEISSYEHIERMDEFQTSPHMARFIEAFDAGVYPELIDDDRGPY